MYIHAIEYQITSERERERRGDKGAGTTAENDGALFWQATFKQLIYSFIHSFCSSFKPSTMPSVFKR